METKSIIKYTTYGLGIVALVSLVILAPIQVIVLAVCAATNILYVNK